MARRNILLVNNEIYHIVNRGVEKRPIFTTPKEFRRFFELIQFYYRQRPKRFSRLSRQERQTLVENQEGELLVDIISFCLMPNHFHLLIRQRSDNGISCSLRKITDSYSKYFNILHKRAGPLFQGNFKAIRIEDDRQLLHITRYIHLNPLTSKLVNQIDEYPWSSFREYIGKSSREFCSKEVVLDQFSTPASYEKFVLDYKNFATQLKIIKNLVLEEV